jgi:tetratricopeptide (TPR) repeat protein
MFLMCSEQYKTSYSYFNLGVASYNLGLYDEAEKVLGVVNFMDSSNTLTWAYLTLSLLNKKDPPINAAFETMNEALKLGLADQSLLVEIFDACLRVGQYKAARDVQEHLLQVMVGNKWSKRVRALFVQMCDVIKSHERLEVNSKLSDDLWGLCNQFLTQFNSQNESLHEQMKQYVALLSCTLECLPSDNKSLVPAIFL